MTIPTPSIKNRIVMHPAQLKTKVNPFIKKHKEVIVLGLYMKKDGTKRPFSGIVNSPIGVKGIGETTAEAVKNRNVLKYYDVNRKAWRSFRIELFKFLIFPNLNKGTLYYRRGDRKPTMAYAKRVLGRHIKTIRGVFPSYSINRILETSTKKTLRLKLLREFSQKNWTVPVLIRITELVTGTKVKAKDKKKLRLITNLVGIIRRDYTKR